MTRVRSPNPRNPRIRNAIAELERMIVERYPDATFEVGRGSDPEYIYLTAVVDTEDEDVIDLVGDRLLQMDVEEGVPILVMPVRPAGHGTLAEMRRGEGS